jgi:hypothetical protein
VVLRLGRRSLADTSGSRHVRKSSARLGDVDPDLPTVDVTLWRSDAVVLFDWLMTVDLDTVPVTHPAEKQALADLLNRLEGYTDVPGVTQEEIDQARQQVSGDMGW